MGVNPHYTPIPLLDYAYRKIKHRGTWHKQNAVRYVQIKANKTPMIDCSQFQRTNVFRACNITILCGLEWPEHCRNDWLIICIWSEYNCPLSESIDGGSIKLPFICMYTHIVVESCIQASRSWRHPDLYSCYILSCFINHSKKTIHVFIFYKGEIQQHDKKSEPAVVF